MIPVSRPDSCVRARRRALARLFAAAAALALLLAVPAAAAQEGSDAPMDSGLVTVESAHDLDATLERLQGALEENDFGVLAVVDHAQNAASVDLELLPTRLVIFGRPQAGTPLMQAERSVAIDLPQKMLLWQDEAGAVYVTYNDPAYLAARHGIEGQDERLAAIADALAMLAEAATAP